MIVFYHNDLDGRCVAAIAYKNSPMPIIEK
jgi:oligoribonuclease NrnB/cAMP/cGMP phosphodiesterase (DHH superfamily)